MRLMLIPCFMALVFVLGCGKSSEEKNAETSSSTTIKKEAETKQEATKTAILTEGNTKPAVEPKDEKAKTETRDSKSKIDSKVTVSKNEVPDGFPLSLMPNSKILQASKQTKTDGPPTYQVSTEIVADPKAVADFYEKALTDKGLKVERSESTSDEGSQAMLSANTDQEECLIMILKEAKDQNTSAIIQWRVKK